MSGDTSESCNCNIIYVSHQQCTTSDCSLFQVLTHLQLLATLYSHASKTPSPNLMISIGLLASCVLHSITQIRGGIVERWLGLVLL